MRLQPGSQAGAPPPTVVEVVFGSATALPQRIHPQLNLFFRYAPIAGALGFTLPTRIGAPFRHVGTTLPSLGTPFRPLGTTFPSVGGAFLTSGTPFRRSGTAFLTSGTPFRRVGEAFRRAGKAQFAVCPGEKAVFIPRNPIFSLGKALSEGGDASAGVGGGVIELGGAVTGLGGPFPRSAAPPPTVAEAVSGSAAPLLAVYSVVSR